MCGSRNGSLQPCLDTRKCHSLATTVDGTLKLKASMGYGCASRNMCCNPHKHHGLCITCLLLHSGMPSCHTLNATKLMQLLLNATCATCRYAVRRVQFSPHAENVLASCSYDMSVKMWDYRAPEDALIRSWDHHTEFAIGVEFSLQREGLMASTGWDEFVCVWQAPQGMP